MNAEKKKPTEEVAETPAIEPQRLTFNLNIEDANAVLAALAAQPYGKVAALIANLQSQAKAQLK